MKTDVNLQLSVKSIADSIPQTLCTGRISGCDIIPARERTNFINEGALCHGKSELV